MAGDQHLLFLDVWLSGTRAIPFCLGPLQISLKVTVKMGKISDQIKVGEDAVKLLGHGQTPWDQGLGRNRGSKDEAGSPGPGW